MSFIIKGIDLPKKAELFIKEGETTIVFAIDNDGRVLKREHHEWHLTDFEVIQIPKGARLIDANEVKNDMMNEMCMTGYQSRAMDVIEFAPTILEDEEEVPFKEVVKDYISATYGDISNL